MKSNGGYWYIIVEPDIEKVSLVRTSGDGEAAKKKYFQLCGLGSLAEVEDAMENRDVRIIFLQDLLDAPMHFYEIW